MYYSCYQNCTTSVKAIPLRLGVTGVSSEYIQELKAALQTPWCVGILGGKTHHAIYYVGYRYKMCFVFTIILAHISKTSYDMICLCPERRRTVSWDWIRILLIQRYHWPCLFLRLKYINKHM